MAQTLPAPARSVNAVRLTDTLRASRGFGRIHGGTIVPKLFFEDFTVGRVAEYGDALVTADEIKAFAAAFDPQPMHLDEEAARATIVGGLCASGWHTCCMMMRIVADGFILNSSSMGAPGVEEIRWFVPVRPGDRLRVRATVLETREPKSRPDFGFVRTKFEVLNAAGVCVMQTVGNLMFGRRTPRADASSPRDGSPR
jgi:acyl dehydratase